MKANIRTLMAAVTLAAGLAAAPMALGQADLQRQQLEKQEQERKREQRAANQETRAERREAKHEREELNNMPKPVRQTLRAETQNAKNIDYYRVEGQAGTKAAGREFGAKFTATNGHQMDVRVDRQGKVLSRQDLTALAAAQPAAAPQQPAPATPTPAPTTPAPTTPAPTSPTASTQAPESGNPIYRRLQATEVPANIRAVLDKDTASGKDVRYYRTKYGSQLAYEAKWDDPKTGKEMRHYVSDAGQTLVRGESVDDENERLASAAERRFRERDRERRDRETREDTATTAGARETKTGRVELNDMPKAVQTQMRRLTEGGKDVKFYRTKYGSEAAFEAKFTDSKGKEQSIYLDQDGKVLKREDESNKSSANAKSAK